MLIKVESESVLQFASSFTASETDFFPFASSMAFHLISLNIF